MLRWRVPECLHPGDLWPAQASPQEAEEAEPVAGRPPGSADCRVSRGRGLPAKPPRGPGQSGGQL